MNIAKLPDLLRAKRYRREIIMDEGTDFSGEKVVKYAHEFLANRMETFQKDVERCLMDGCKVDQAYFPALMTCIGFTEFMSGLYAGKIESGNDQVKLEKYITRFLPLDRYDNLKVKILYGFRHKLAHLAYPHGVIMLTEKRKQRRIAWEVFANEPKPPIQIDDFDTKYLTHPVVPPWKVPYDCKLTIGLRALYDDTVQSVAKYLDELKSDRKMQNNFAKCIRKIFPPDDTRP